MSRLAGNVNIGLGKGELPVATLTHESGATAEVYILGAHVTSWKTSDGVERLFVSSASAFARGAAIRGGIPVCWPQFSGRGALPKHGFARTSEAWEIESMSSEGGVTTLVLCLEDSEATRAVWPHAFKLRYTVTLGGGGGGELDTQLEVTHAGTDGAPPLAFAAALHTYFAVDDVGAVAVTGLRGLRYEDNAAGGGLAGPEEADAVAIDGEVDRVYLDAPERLAVVPRAGGAPPLVTLAKRGFRDAVLWNVGETKGAGMGDLGSGEWRNYVCVEAGAIGTPVTLQPGETFVGGQTFAAGGGAAVAAPKEEL